MTVLDTMQLTIDAGVARLTLTRAEAGNAMNDQFFRDFELAVDELVARGAAVRAVLLRSTGRFFGVGGDVSQFHSVLDELPTAVLAGTAAYNPALARLVQLDAPLVVAVQGAAMGGALGLVANADLVISARSARFGSAYVGIGFSPDLGSTTGLAARLGPARARRFLLLNELLDAESALAIGLVDEVVDDDGLEAASEAAVVALSTGPTRAYGELRRLIDKSLATPLADQLDDEAQTLARIAATADAREGITSFVEKRRPQFGGS